MGDFPFITYRYPISSNGPVADPLTTVAFSWNVNVVSTQFSDPVQLERFVVLIRKSNGDEIPLTFGSYSSVDRQVKLIPSSPLEFGETYIVIVNSGVKDITGRYSQQDYRWDFKVAGSAVGKVQTVSPTDAVVLNYFPNFQFLAIPATGVVHYELQICTQFDFTNNTYDGVFTFTQTGSDGTLSVTPAGYFPYDTTYYWRIQASTQSATGAWSSIYSFYFGQARQAHPTTQAGWSDPLPFQWVRNTWPNGLSNQPSFPVIGVIFNNPLSSVNFTLTAESLLPRNDEPATYLTSSVAGTWSAPGSAVYFTPTDAIQNNTRYQLTIPYDTTDIYGNQLGTDLVFYFTGQYDPYYISIREIRARFMGSDINIPDDLINYYIYVASLEAKARYYGLVFFPGVDTFLGDQLKEQFVRDTPNLNSYGLLKWTAAAATYLMLQAILRREMFNIGKTRTLGDDTVKVDKDFLAAIQEAKKDAQEELLAYQELLTPASNALSASPSSLWSSGSWNSDRSVGHPASSRQGFSGGRMGGFSTGHWPGA